MSRSQQDAQRAANQGLAAPNTKGLSHTERQRAEQAFRDQQAKNNKK